HAQPIDRAIDANERGGHAIADDGVGVERQLRILPGPELVWTTEASGDAVQIHSSTMPHREARVIASGPQASAPHNSPRCSYCAATAAGETVGHMTKLAVIALLLAAGCRSEEDFRKEMPPPEEAPATAAEKEPPPPPKKKELTPEE